MGSNLEDPERHLADAVSGLRCHLEGVTVAPLFRARPLSPHPQPDFLNTALTGRSTLGPEELLAVGKALELAAGRRRGPRHGPRPLDVDLLLWGDRVVAGPALTVPHPGLRRRRFVLAPLARIAPELRVPPDGVRVRELLAAVGQEGEVEEVAWGRPPLEAG